MEDYTAKLLKEKNSYKDYYEHIAHVIFTAKVRF